MSCGANSLRCLAVVLLASPAFADEEIPFPVLKSTTASKDRATYVVEGRMRLPVGVAVTCKQGIRILGRGDDPTLEVAGTLVIEGQPRQEVVIENLRIEPAPQFQEIRIEWARMSGSIATPEGGAAAGPLAIDCTTVSGPVSLAFGQGEIRLMHSELQGQVTLAGVPREGAAAAPLKIRILNCCRGTDRAEEIQLNAGFWSGLAVSRASDVLVRANWLTGGAYDFEDCGELVFDGNTAVSADRVAFRQTKPGGFKRTRVMKSDFYGVEVRLESPKAETADKVVIDKCWFGGTEDPQKVLEAAVRDGSRDATSGARAQFRKINKSPLGIGGTPQR
ncbi:MAG TPA: hypothetical protein VFY93_00590 [Planctomycetota bacterium]|nr:hypothetical protein [Planctomycetota bacterium]